MKSDKRSKSKARGLKAIKIQDFRQLLADNLLAEIRNGTPLKRAAKLLKLNTSTIDYWCEKWPEFESALTRARKFGAAIMAEDTLDIADDKHLDTAQARNMIGTRQWLAGKHNKTYADKPLIDVNINTHENYLRKLKQPPPMALPHAADAVPILHQSGVRGEGVVENNQGG